MKRIVIAIALLMMAATANADIDYTVLGSIPGHANTLDFETGRGTFEGIDLGVLGGGRADFQTGAFLGTDGGKDWRFGPGGSLVVQDAASNVLLSGVFNGESEIIPVGNNTFKVFGGGFADSSGNPGGISLLFNATASPGGSFVATALQSGNIATQAVPEPGTFITLGVGLITLLLRVMYFRVIG
jgi:hypothetical protein